MSIINSRGSVEDSDFSDKYHALNEFSCLKHSIKSPNNHFYRRGFYP
jgi:hypothetical protein